MISKVGPYSLNEIYTGDALELSNLIPDNSIDMIFTDPEYDRLDHYSWLAKTAIRILKPDKPCLVWCSQPALSSCRSVMESEGLIYHYTLTYVGFGKAYRLFRYHIFPKTTPCLWMGKGSSIPRKWFIDTVVVYQVFQTNIYKWHKNLEPIRVWMDAFTNPGDIIFDPFAGEGSVPKVCIELDRRFLAFKILSDVAEKARSLTYNTHGMEKLF